MAEAICLMSRSGDSFEVKYSLPVDDDLMVLVDSAIRLVHSKIENSFKLGAVIPAGTLLEKKQ